MKSQVVISKCGSYDPLLIEEKVREALDQLGGLDKFIRPGSRVLLKPNILMAKDPRAGITTHPELVRALIRILKNFGCRVCVGDSPSVWGKYIENVGEVYRVAGIAEVCRQEGAELVSLEKKRMRQNLPLASILDECAAVVNLPKFKTHTFMLMSGAIKNLFGLVSGTFKTELHKKYFSPEEFAKILVDIYAEVRPALTIVDGIMAMEGDGPATSGKLRDLGLLIAGSDAVAIDSVLADLAGIAPQAVLTTQEAAKRGLGQADLSAIKILGQNPRELAIKPFLLPSVPKKTRIPLFLLNLIKGWIRYYPAALRQVCLRCGACVKICPYQCILLKPQGISFRYRKCIACFCCQETCPAAAIKIKRSILAKIIGL